MEQVVKVEQVMVVLVLMLVMEVVVVLVGKGRPGMEVADLRPPHYLPCYHSRHPAGRRKTGSQTSFGQP